MAYRHPVGPLCIGDPGGWYNGFSWDERVATNPIQAKALRDGVIQRPVACGVTRMAPSGDPRGSGYIFMHNEDYARPLQTYAVGRSVHHLLHSRFTNPLPWLRLVRRCYAHGAWFTFLTLDPQDMRRPYGEIYPHGLPPDGEPWPDVADALSLSPEAFPCTVEEARTQPVRFGQGFKLLV